jgi:hypothetical protein
LFAVYLVAAIKPRSNVGQEPGKEVLSGEFRLRRKPCVIPSPGTWDGKKMSKIVKVKEV